MNSKVIDFTNTGELVDVGIFLFEIKVNEEYQKEENDTEHRERELMDYIAFCKWRRS